MQAGLKGQRRKGIILLLVLGESPSRLAANQEVRGQRGRVSWQEQSTQRCLWLLIPK